MLKVKKSFKEDWTLLPLLVVLGTGFIIAILDFVFLQNLTFQVFALAGLCLLLIGGKLGKQQNETLIYHNDDKETRMSKSEEFLNYIKESRSKGTYKSYYGKKWLEITENLNMHA